MEIEIGSNLMLLCIVMTAIFCLSLCVIFHIILHCCQNLLLIWREKQAEDKDDGR